MKCNAPGNYLKGRKHLTRAEQAQVLRSFDTACRRRGLISPLTLQSKIMSASRKERTTLDW